MGLMDGKRGLIVGIANERSFATSIAERLLHEGADCGTVQASERPRGIRVQQGHERVHGVSPGR